MLRGSLFQALSEIVGSTELRKCKLETKVGGNSYLSNTPTNLCMALLTFSLFCFVLYCYVFVQYCNVNTIQYNAMHKFVRVLDNPQETGKSKGGDLSRPQHETSGKKSHLLSQNVDHSKA